MKKLPNEQLKWYKHLISTLDTIETNTHIVSINEAICLLIDSLIKQGFQKFTTGRDYYYTLKVFSSWCREFKVNLVSQLSKNLLLDFFEQAKNKKKYSSYFLKELKVCLRKLLQLLFSKGLLKENLANELKIPTKMQTKEYIPLSSSGQNSVILLTPPTPSLIQSSHLDEAEPLRTLRDLLSSSRPMSF